MAYDGWVDFGGELINLDRTMQLAQALGVNTVWLYPHLVDFIGPTLGETGYTGIENAPWYDPGYDPSSEFAGVVTLSISGLDDSTLAAATVEHISDGGSTGRSRSATLPLVFSGAIIASSERGAEFGLRWLNRRLREGSADSSVCRGSDLTYFRYASLGAPKAHRRDVRLTRGVNVTRKRVDDCSSTWFVTWTMTANDPYEYGEPVPAITELGTSPTATGPKVDTSGSLVLTLDACNGINYDPIYDPAAPALIAPPAPPNILPNNWDMTPGSTFDRFWARLSPVEPSDLNVVPVITLTTGDDPARMVRVSIYSNSALLDEQCEPLFSTVLTYLSAPGLSQLVIDGEQQVVYFWDGFSPVVRRADSLAYSPEGGPVEWTAFNDPDGFLVALDLFSDSDGIEGSGEVELSLALVPKSD